MRRRSGPVYDPATDSALKIWLDPSDSSSASLLDTTSASISNGETIGTYKSKAGTARSFTQHGTNARPTWDSSGINGLGAVRCNSQILTTRTTMSDFASMSYLTIMQVLRLNGTGNAGALFSMTMLDQGTGKYDLSMVQHRSTTSYYYGGRRARGDSFAAVSAGTTPATAYIQTAVVEYANAVVSLFANGIEVAHRSAWQSAGTTNAADPYAISIGGFAQETSLACAGLSDAWAGETLVWLSSSMITPAQLFAPHDYLRRKWGIG